MKMKKILMLLVAFMATAAFASCGDDDDGTSGGGGTNVSSLTVTKTSLTFTKDGGSETVNVQAPQQASATTDASWLTVEAGTMSANLKVTPLKVTAAAMTTETADRTATITVKAGGQTASISVTQKAGDVLVVAKTEYDVSAEGGTIDVQVTANGTVTVSVDKDWVTQAQGNDSYVFSVAPNKAGARTATITFTLNRETATVTVRQEAGQPSAITAKAMDIAKQMYPGWNLGNTMEGGNNANNWSNNGGLGAETSWQQTKTTQAIIDFVKQQGFRSVRIPAAWVMGHITDKANVTIDPAWLNRVQEIVDYCINDGLYVFINDHWDGGWLEDSFGDTSDATVKANSEKLTKLWTQIAEHFKDYDEHLLFAGLNEPYVHGSVNTGMVNALIKYEQTFIDAVRATGGNNGKRTLIVQGPQTDIDQTDQYFDVSRLTDPAGAGYLMVEVHFYGPWNFAGMEKDESWGKMFFYWGAANHVSGSSYNASWGEESWLQDLFKKMKTKFADKGYPVIIGEYGCMWRDLSSLSSENQDKHNASVKLFHKSVNQYGPSNGMIPFVWGTNYCSRNGVGGAYTVLNRATLSVFNKYAMEGIQEGAAAAKWPY